MYIYIYIYVAKRIMYINVYFQSICKCERNHTFLGKIRLYYLFCLCITYYYLLIYYNIIYNYIYIYIYIYIYKYINSLEVYIKSDCISY